VTYCPYSIDTTSISLYFNYPEIGLKLLNAFQQFLGFWCNFHFLLFHFSSEAATLACTNEHNPSKLN